MREFHLSMDKVFLHLFKDKRQDNEEHCCYKGMRGITKLWCILFGYSHHNLIF